MKRYEIHINIEDKWQSVDESDSLEDISHYASMYSDCHGDENVRVIENKEIEGWIEKQEL